MAGPLWMIGGLLIVFICFLVSGELAFTLFMTVTMIIAIIPLVYSYVVYK